MIIYTPLKLENVVVSKADRIKVAERVRTGHLTSGGSPLKRKRALYRALDRGDVHMRSRFKMELMTLRMLDALHDPKIGLG